MSHPPRIERRYPRGLPATTGASSTTVTGESGGADEGPSSSVPATTEWPGGGEHGRSSSSSGGGATPPSPPPPHPPPITPSAPLQQRVARRVEQCTSVFALLIQTTLYWRSAAALSPRQHAHQAVLILLYCGCTLLSYRWDHAAWLKHRWAEGLAGWLLAGTGHCSVHGRPWSSRLGMQTGGRQVCVAPGQHAMRRRT